MSGGAGWVGARPADGGTRFRVWASAHQRVDVVVGRTGGASAVHPLVRGADGVFAGFAPGVHAGDRYVYRLDGAGAFPDPASRFQPDGVHGPSEVIDPSTYKWHDAQWPGRPMADLVVYELHVGTFTADGTFAAATRRLGELADLGVTAIELMPVADFPGDHNWGYDGVALWAPSRAYGRPDDLRRLADTAHQLGLAVLLDVVYNHLGPDGNYLAAFSPHYFSSRHRTPWGDAINYDDADSGPVRAFVTGNAAYWVGEFHIDGLRLDATHAIVDDSATNILADVARAARRAAPGRQVVVIAEDNRNLVRLVRPESEGGYGLDGVWSDDFHHIVRRMLAGDHEGWFADFAGTTGELATALRRGWLHAGTPRGTDPSGIPLERFVIALQTHDQVGNRAYGDRLHHAIDLAAWRAASLLLLLSPETPLLFMGQEWGASTPFRYFTDHNPELGALVTEGRRQEFKAFSAFADPAVRHRIPDPQAPETFLRSRLDWSERSGEPHASLLRFTRELLHLRRETVARLPAGAIMVRAVGADGVCLLRKAGHDARLLVARLAGAGPLTVPPELLAGVASRGWTRRLDSEQGMPDEVPIDVRAGVEGVQVEFGRPGGVVLDARTG